MFPPQLRPSPETKRAYTAEWLELVSEIGPERFSAALIEAVRGSEYFPVIAKIRQCAGVSEKQQNAAGSDAAWLYVREHVRKYSSLYEKNAPKLPARIAHAARLVGGLGAIEYCPDDSLPFMRRDFCAAWERYQESSAALNELLLAAPLTPRLLAMESRPERTTVNAAEVLSTARKMPAPARELSDEDLERLKTQAIEVAEKFTQELDQ